MTDEFYNRHTILPSNVGLGGYHPFPDQVIMARANRGVSLGTQVYRYASYRHMRLSLKGVVEEIFDEVSIKSPLPYVYRTSSAKLLLDGNGAVVNLAGHNKIKHCSCYVEIWAASSEQVKTIKATILEILNPWITEVIAFSIDWKFMGPQGMGSASFEEELADEIHDEAYPYWGESLSSLSKRYLDSDETVLLILGTPGTGKTRFVRSIFREIHERKGSCNVLFTGDQKVLENEQIFAEFLTGDHDVFVIEDADHLMLPRADGNKHLHPFLTIADGIVKAQGRKIVFTTNLPNINDVDEALIRPGRCFAALRTGLLDISQALALARKLQPGIPEETVLSALKAKNSLADIYKLCKTYAASK